MNRPIRVLLADDHAVVRKGIREVLEEDPELIVVAAACDGGEAVRLVGEHHPEVAVLDIQMPRVTGIGIGHGARPACTCRSRGRGRPSASRRNPRVG